MIDPEIFINQKILKSYVPIAEPIAVIFFATRKLKKFDIRLILNREVQKAENLFQQKIKSGITEDDIEEAKINFAQPNNLFHCLLLKTIPGNLSFDKRLSFVVKTFEKLMDKYLSFFNREVIRENFINGVQETILLLHISTYNIEKKEIEDNLQSENYDKPISDEMEINGNTLFIEHPVLSTQGLFKDKSLYPTIINKMIELNVLDTTGKLKGVRGNKTKLNLMILQLQDLNIIEIEGLTDEAITNMLNNDFGDSSKYKHFAQMRADFNAGSLPVVNKRFIEKIKAIIK
jgi:hypothetical protein